MKQKISKKILSVVLLLSMLVSAIPISGISALSEADKSGAELFASNVVDELKGVKPTLNADKTKIILPESPNPNYTVGLFGSDNHQVIDLEGNVHQPLVNTRVNLIYKMTSKNNPDEVVEGNFNIPITIEGKYKTEEGDNKVPDVLPALREWKGKNGNLMLDNNSEIVISESQFADLKETAESIKFYFKDMLNRDISIRKGAPEAGDIYLELDFSDKVIGDEGYYLTIDDYVSIKASAKIGVLYGGVTITQILYQDKENFAVLPKGICRDYPAYKVRGGFLDVGRAWVPLEYVEQITKYMAWYKMNEIVLHINETASNNEGYFRLESNLPGLTSEQHYTKAAYRQYQKDALKYGVNVITEIDTPGHSRCFINMDDPWPNLNNDGYNLDITNPVTIEKVKALWDEYITGEDPVFVNKRVHIGCDEYPRAYAEEMRKYTDDLIKHVKSRGYEARVWGEYGKGGMNGDTPITTENTQTYYWAVDLSDYNLMYEMGFDVVNACGPILYIVPAGNYGCYDYLEYETLYYDWQVNYFTVGGSEQKPAGHPQTVGANFCLWNDLHMSNGGFTKNDIFDRFKGGIALVAEKTWHGPQKHNQTLENFQERVDKLGIRAPGANPSYFIESLTDTLVDYNFESKADTNTVAADNSGNKFDASIVNGTIKSENENKVLEFNGNGYMSLPMDYVGFPYTVEMDVKLKSNDDISATLFTGDEGDFCLNVDEKGRLGFKREIYTFKYPYKIPVNQWIHLQITSNNKETTLIVNDSVMYSAANMKTGDRNGKDSSTTVLSTKKMFDKFIGQVDNIKISRKAVNLQEINAYQNYALKATAEASSTDSGNGRYSAYHAVDGKIDDRSFLSFGSRNDVQTLTVDMGEVKKVNKVVIDFAAACPAYEILVSLDKKNWTSVYNALNKTPEGEKRTDVIEFPVHDARYIQFKQKRKCSIPEIGGLRAGCRIYEFTVSGFDDIAHKNSIAASEFLLEAGKNSPLGTNYITKINSYRNELKVYTNSKMIFYKMINATKENLDHYNKLYAEALGLPSDILVTGDKQEIKVGQTLKLKADVTGKNKTVTWKTSNKKVATIDENGLINAVGTGYVTFTGTNAGGISDTYEMKVVEGEADSNIVQLIEGVTIEESDEFITVEANDQEVLKINLNNGYELFADEDCLRKVNGNVNLSEQIIRVYAKLNDDIRPITIIKPAKQYDFSDINESAWYVPYVNDAVNLGIVKGTAYDENTGKSTLEPESFAQRCEALAFVLRSMFVDTKQYSNETVDFEDYKGSSEWYDSYIKTAYTLGITKGSEDEDGKVRIKAFDNITREQFFTMFARMLQLKDKDDSYKSQSLDEFKDKDKIGDYAVDSIKYLIHNGYIEGSDGLLTPLEPIRRSEIIKIVTLSVKK